MNRNLNLPAWPPLRLPVSLLLLLALACGCASSGRFSDPPADRFDFPRNTFAYANELVWDYAYDPAGRWTSHRREPPPDYTLHCFVVARSAAQFFKFARFDLQQPVADDSTYRRLIRQVIATNPRKPVPESRRIVIPGYSDLHVFSQAKEALLKAECGSAWQSYFQRGNWRMLFPFSRKEQEKVADRLLGSLRKEGVALVHLVRFPQLSINHAVVLFDVQVGTSSIEFTAYDPNSPAQPVSLVFDRGQRTFFLGPNHYFPGGRVDVYQIYHRWDY